jgi:hypothetical protein
MIQLKWLKTQLETYGSPDKCEVDWKTLDELFEQAKQMNDLKGKTFQMTEVHLKLLSNLNVAWISGECGLHVETDIADILTWEEPLTNLIERIHRELETALQIVLVTQKFEPGLYHLENEFTKDWIKIN